MINNISYMSVNVYFEKFVTNLYNLINDMNRYYPNDQCTKILGVFDKLDMNKLLLRFNSLISKNEQKLQEKDESLFMSDIIPIINFKTIWPNLTSAQKNKCWTYLQILYLNSGLLVNNIKKSNDIKLTVDGVEHEFDPFVGVGSNIEYSVTDIMEGPKNLPEDETNNPGIGSIIKLFGFDKMLDLDKLTEQIINMTDEEIIEQTENIKQLFGEHLDEKTNAFLNDLLLDIRDELKNEDIKKGDFDVIGRVASRVAEKSKHKTNGVDINHFLNSTQHLSSKLGMDGFNPMSILSKVNIQDKKSLESLIKNPEALQNLINEAKEENERMKTMSNKEKLRQKIKNKEMSRSSQNARRK